jgi:hypothetical protein
MLRKLLILCGFLFHQANPCASQQKVLVDNLRPRLDEGGEIVDAHDGRVIQFGSVFYWYGTRYGKTNGFTNGNEYVCYSSTNLKVWKYEGVLLPNKPQGVYYRPHVVYNSKTGKYILWYNWYPALWNGQFGVAESSSPVGPFNIVNSDVSVKHKELGVGDLGVFVDQNGKAYLSYNTINGHRLSVEELDEKFTASTLNGSEFIADNCEAGSMFKRDGLYYLLTDYTCCFCAQGSGARVYTSKSPLGPYEYRQNINRYPGRLLPQLTDKATADNQFETFTAKAQHIALLTLSRAAPVSEMIISQFTGDRNGQCGEVNNPVVHEPITRFSFNLAFFHEGEWHQLKPSKIDVQSGSMVERYRISFPATVMEQIRVTPVYPDSSAQIRLSEITLPMQENYKCYMKGLTDGKPIIPAQQAYVMELNGSTGRKYVWIGDLWGSASDNVKGHDYQFWSSPLEFYKNGTIRNLEWSDRWQLTLKN